MKKRKYGNKKIITNDGEFDSKVEYNRWLVLRDAEMKGEISNLRRQVEYTLVPVQYKTVVKHYKRSDKAVIRVAERAVKYIADFVYNKPDGQLVVEDVKGYRDEKYPIKRKLMLYFHGIYITEVQKASAPI